MHPKILATLILSMILTLACALPPAFTAKGNPSLYKELRDKAEKNLKRLDSRQKKLYTKLLKHHDDVLIAFLLAYESDANLTSADPADVESNYLFVKDLLETKGTVHSPEFFLSYVAKQTVSDERIEAYRRGLMNDGLREIMDDATDETDLFRKVSQWCVARLKFQPTSGRDQSPLDITQRSILGRCEEMQILFVAAARTIGLPSRPASTPWWPHTDNNHAWAEVWLEDAWHYTGDMDAAYYPDQTWFSGLIDKTVLILADGTLPSERDEVLVKGKYDCVINSIRNYAGERTRSLALSTLDEQGKPLPKTSVGVMVYNWGTLRALTWIQTDDEGKFTLSVGRGAFYLSAYKEGKQALIPVPSGEDTLLKCSLVLRPGPLPDQNELLSYPSNPFEWKTAPEEWNTGVAEAKEQWNNRDQSFSARQTMYPDSLTGVLASAFRGNYTEFRRFYSRYPSLDPNFIAFILNQDPQYFDPKVLWQASAEQFEALYHQFQGMEHGFEYADLASVIAPTTFYEELSQPFPLEKGVMSLFPKSFYSKGRGATRLEKLNTAMRWLKKQYRIDPDKALQGLIPLHVAFNRKYLTPYQYRILGVNLARANGVPAEFTRQPNLIWVQYDNGQWGYYDLEKCAPETDLKDEGANVMINVLALDEFGAPIAGIKEKLRLSRYGEGSFYWLDQSFEDHGGGRYEISVPKGKYYLNAGYRVSDSKTAFQLKHLDLAAADSLSLELTLTEYPRRWDTASDELLALIADADTTGISVVLIGNHDRENSIRLAEKIRDAGRAFLWLGYEPALSQIAEYWVSPAWKALAEAGARERLRTITLIRKGEGWQSFEGLWDKLP